MTREEASEDLKAALTENYIPEPEAVDMAIRSLVAWEKVAKEISKRAVTRDWIVRQTIFEIIKEYSGGAK